MKRRAALLAAIVIGPAVMSACSSSISAKPRGVPKTDDPVLVGSYVQLSGMSPAQARALRQTQLDRTDRIVSFYFKWDDPLPKRYRAVPPEATLMLSWRGTTYADILDGSQDRMIEADARALAAYGRPVLLRFAWEMNGFWFAWGGANNPSGADGYVQAWRHVHDIFTAVGTPNVSWVWCVNWNDNPHTPANAGRHYYPGDAYVDWIAVDGFSDAGETPEGLFGAFYAEYAGRKPLMIAEAAVATPDRGDPRPDAQADWVTNLAGWIEQHPDIRALVWFDTDLETETGGTTNWRIDGTPAELAAYRRMVHSPYFGG